MPDGICQLCGRETGRLTRHHLTPRTRIKKRRKKDRGAAIRAALEDILMICRPCHNQVHAVCSERELERDYNTREKLLEHPEIRKFVDWVSRRGGGDHVPVRRGRALTTRGKTVRMPRPGKG